MRDIICLLHRDNIVTTPWKQQVIGSGNDKHTLKRDDLEPTIATITTHSTIWPTYTHEIKTQRQVAGHM